MQLRPILAATDRLEGKANQPLIEVDEDSSLLFGSEWCSFIVAVAVKFKCLAQVRAVPGSGQSATLAERSWDWAWG